MNERFLGNVLIKSNLTCLCRVKWFQVLLFNTNNFIQHYSFVCT